MSVLAQPIIWERASGGNHDDYGYAIESDSNGNVYVAGSSSTTNNGDLPASCYQGATTLQNPWMIKMDSVGNVVWSKCLSIDAEVQSLVKINDSEFALTGWWRGLATYSSLWIAVVDSSGNITTFNHGYGFPNSDEIGYDILCTSNNHFWSVGKSNTTFGHGDFDFYVVTSDSIGYNSQVYGGSGYDQCHKIIRLHDGNFLLVGSTFSNDGDITFNHGSGDVWVVKIDSMRNLLWQKTYGGSQWDAGFGAAEDSVGDIYITGWTESNDGDVIGNHGSIDGWIFKIDSTGILLWQKCIGGTYADVIFTSPIFAGNKLLIGASSASNDGDVTNNHNNSSTSDYLIVEMDTTGLIIQTNCYGGSYGEYLYDCKFTNGKLLTTGTTESGDGDVTNYHFNPTTVVDAWPLILDVSSIVDQVVLIDANSDFSIFPNPSQDFIYINKKDFSENSSLLVKITNSVGQICKQEICTSPCKINIAELSVGIYFISLTLNQEQLVYKFIKN